MQSDSVAFRIDEKGYVSIFPDTLFILRNFSTCFFGSGKLRRNITGICSEVNQNSVERGGFVPVFMTHQRSGSTFTIMTGEGELHDCGIVYHPEASYILCVMTSGKDFEEQKSAIAQVSRVVYEAVSSLSFDASLKNDSGALH
jgi:hypothetical protein